MKLIKTLLSIIFFSIFIEIVLRVFETPSYLFPKPSEILTAFQSQLGTAFYSWAITTSQALVGLFVAVLAASLLAALTVFLPGRVSDLINNVGIVIQSTPLLAVAPLLSLWFGQTFAAKSAAACLACFFPLLTGWLTGIKAVDVEQQQLFDNLKANNIQKVKYLIIPTALPYFFGGIRVAAPLALLGAIIGEFVGSSAGIGFQILSSSYYMRTPLMFSYIIIAALTGWLFSLAITKIERKVLFWHGQQRVNN